MRSSCYLFIKFYLVICTARLSEQQKHSEKHLSAIFAYVLEDGQNDYSFNRYVRGTITFPNTTLVTDHLIDAVIRWYEITN